MRGKLIVIEGTDCSGKETQSNLLCDKLNNMGIKCKRYSFPSYDTPTGRIIGGPYLGKSYICESWFSEGAPNVDPIVSSLYYAADRKYNISKIESSLSSGINVILDRYTYSNMAHQGGKFKSKEERINMYNFIDNLEFKLLKLPQSDIKIFLHMPYKVSCKLKEGRKESLDQNEVCTEHLLMAEKAYLELADMYEFKKLECNRGDNPKGIEEINEELFNYVYSSLKN